MRASGVGVVQHPPKAREQRARAAENAACAYVPFAERDLARSARHAARRRRAPRPPGARHALVLGGRRGREELLVQPVREAPWRWFVSAVGASAGARGRGRAAERSATRRGSKTMNSLSIAAQRRRRGAAARARAPRPAADVEQELVGRCRSTGREGARASSRRLARATDLGERGALAARCCSRYSHCLPMAAAVALAPHPRGAPPPPRTSSHAASSVQRTRACAAARRRRVWASHAEASGAPRGADGGADSGAARPDPSGAHEREPRPRAATIRGVRGGRGKRTRTTARRRAARDGCFRRTRTRAAFKTTRKRSAASPSAMPRTREHGRQIFSHEPALRLHRARAGIWQNHHEQLHMRHLTLKIRQTCAPSP